MMAEIAGVGQYLFSDMDSNKVFIDHQNLLRRSFELLLKA